MKAIGILLLMMFSSIACFASNKGETSLKGYRWLIPDGFEGWICLNLSVKGAPSLKEEDGFLVVKVPMGGVANTSTATARTSKLREDDFLYYDSRGTRLKTKLNSEGGFAEGRFDKISGKTIPIRLHLWVGDARKEEDWKKSHLPDDQKCGSVK